MVYFIKMMAIKLLLYCLHLGLKAILILTQKIYYQEND